MIYHIILLIDILLGVFAQIVMKKGMRRDYKVTLRIKTIHRDIFRIYFNKYVMVGISFYLLGFVLWLVVISKIDLSYAYPLVSLNYVFIALFSKFLFGETVSRKRWAGIAIILVGVILVTLS